MRVKVTTTSGSTYVFDSHNMTYSRASDEAQIVGYNVCGGAILALPEIIIGEPLSFPVPDGDNYKIVESYPVKDFETLKGV